MNIPFHIARRYFFSKKSNGSFNLISIISGISLLGYIAGAAALVIVLSVFNGFEQLFVSMYNNFDSDIQITAAHGKSFDEHQIHFADFTSNTDIVAFSKVLEENVLLKYGNRQCIATAKGVDDQFLQMTNLDSCMVNGTKMLSRDGVDYAIAGQGIAYQLALDPEDLFNRLVFYVPDRQAENSIDVTGSFRQEAIYPAGTFTVQQEVDEKYVITPLSFIRNLINKPNQLSSIEIKLKKGVSSDDVINQLQQKYPTSTFTIKNRFSQREAFFKVMKSEKLISYFILFFILLIAASNTIGSLFILVIEKQKDIKMLSSMGMLKNKIGMVFIYEGLLQALFGGGIGIALGIVMCYLQEHYGFVQLNEAATFAFQTYPVKMIPSDLLLVLGTVLFLGVITSIYPASRARKLST